jgi:hypothetical protein
MEPTEVASSSVIGLVRNLAQETKTFFRQELELAKTELAEKLKAMAGRSASLAIGGFIAYAGLIVFFIGLGEIIAFAFQKAGMDPALSQFLGFCIIGLIVAGAGVAMLITALKAFRAESLAPERTLHTLQQLRGEPVAIKHAEKHEEPEKPKLSSAQLERKVEKTEDRMGATIEELGRRLSPRQINARIKRRVQERPYRIGLAAMGLGLLSGFWVRHKFSRA